jgi:hypothetical protein
MSVTFNWLTGFPVNSGMYLVELEDGEIIVTHWHDGSRTGSGNIKQAGWDCLTHARATVKKWAYVDDLREVK